MTKPIGSFGEALLRAMGIVSAHEGTSLHRVTDAALAKHKPSLAKATDAVERAIRNEGGMLLELLDDARFTRPLVEKFVARRAAHIKVRLETPNGGGQCDDDAQRHNAPSTNSRDAAQAAGGGHPRGDAHCIAAPAPSSARPGSSDGAASLMTPSKIVPRRAPGHSKRAAHIVAAAAGMRRALLDTVQVNGQPLRNVTAGEALGFADKQKTSAALIERICIGLKERETVGSQISDEEAERRANAGKPAGGGQDNRDAQRVPAPASQDAP